MFWHSQLEYGVFEIPEEKFSEFMKTRDFDGLSVSLPYKERVMEFLDEVSDDARKIGAVNTVLRVDDELRGFNTDWIGAVEALHSGLGSGSNSDDSDLNGKKVIVLGAGGAARAIVYGLLKERASVVVLNRDLEEAQGLADDFGVEVGLLSSIEGRECDILVQATSVWLTAGLDVKIVPDEFVQELGALGGLVMDIVYKPLMTPLLEVAQAAGGRIVTGEKMLLNQACEQFKIWFGKGAPRKEMKEALGAGGLDL